MRFTRLLLLLGVFLLALPAASTAVADQDYAGGTKTATPIKHLVVIYQENVSFDHYFGTYPNAANKPGEPAFHASARTPTIDGLGTTLLTANPNLSNPQRLSRSQAHTCDQNHESQTSLDALTNSSQCGARTDKVPTGPSGPQQARCGYG